MSEGWKCPVCSRGVAPTESHCDHGGVNYIPAPSTGPYYPNVWPSTVTPTPYWWHTVTCGSGSTTCLVSEKDYGYVGVNGH